MALISQLLAAGPTVSFEFMPPKDQLEADRLETTIRELEVLRPSFVSVTYRGGSSSRERTARVVHRLVTERRITAMPHLTCVAHPRSELVEILRAFLADGVENVLALGGDPLPDPVPHRDLTRAVELVRLAREVGVPCVGVAAHPAGHPAASDIRADRRHLAEKLELADFAITQFFFRTDDYERLVGDLDQLGIRKPIIPGIMPVTNLAQVKRMAELSGAPMPDEVVSRLERSGPDPGSVREAGIELATELCRDLLAAGAPGLHFYTLNTSSATREIHRRLGLPTEPGGHRSR